MLRRVLAVWCGAAVVAGVAHARPRSEAFSGLLREGVWSVRNAAAPNSMITSNGWLDVTVGAGRFAFPCDTPQTNVPMLLVEPPSRDGDFTMETRLRVLQAGGVPWGSMAGLGVIRRDGAAAWVWGALESGWIALREYDMANTVDAAWMALVGGESVSTDVWLQVSKHGDAYTFRHKFRQKVAWVQTAARPGGSPEFPQQFGEGEYLVGLIVAGGGQATRVQFDYFDSPELGVLDVSPSGKLPLAWARLRSR
jgi:hypothetical protein